uniref:Uncharacterized protein n=1 Tax=Anguilla anguilla TaxID=7936 RepID=A0A0E9UYA5_ANGAN
MCGFHNTVLYAIIRVSSSKYNPITPVEAHLSAYFPSMIFPNKFVTVKRIATRGLTPHLSYSSPTCRYTDHCSITL